FARDSLERDCEIREERASRTLGFAAVGGPRSVLFESFESADALKFEQSDKTEPASGCVHEFLSATGLRTATLEGAGAEPTIMPKAVLWNRTSSGSYGRFLFIQAEARLNQYRASFDLPILQFAIAR